MPLVALSDPVAIVGLILLAVVLVFFLWWYREPVSMLLNRLKRFRMKDAEAEFAAFPSISPPAAAEPPPVANSPAGTQTASTVAEAAKAAPTIVELRQTMLGQFSERQIPEAKQTFALLQETTTDVREKKVNEVLFHGLSLEKSSSPESRGVLARLAEDPEVADFASMFLGQVELGAGNNDLALKYLERIVSSSTADEDEKVTAANGITEAMRRLGQKKDAREYLVKLLPKLTEDHARASALVRLGKILQEDGEALAGAAAFEKAVEYTPNDVSRRFQAAYSLSELKLDELAIQHYQALLRIKPTHASALNNLGASYDALRLPARAVQSYKASGDAGNARAFGNLAHKLLDLGFREEAQAYAKKGAEGDPDDRVAGALSRLATIVPEEDKEELQALRRAENHQTFLRAFVRRIAGPPASVDFTGTWKEGDLIITVVQRDATIEGQWKEIWEHRFKAQQLGASAIGTFEKQEYSYGTTTWSAPGDILLARDDTRLLMFRRRDGSVLVNNFQRV